MTWAFLLADYPVTTVLVTLTTCFLTYYLTCVVKRPQLTCRQGPWREFLQENLTLLQKLYWPTPWCLDGRFHTFIAYVVRTGLPRIRYEREILPLKDGGIVSLDWASRPSRKDQPILIILPGLIGSSQSEYIKGYFDILKDVDLCSVVFNHRGMGNTELKTHRAYCGANSDDFEEALEHIHSSYPDAPIVANGISLGGMVLGNYLVTRGQKASRFLAAALVYSVPWNLYVSTKSLETPYWNLRLNRSLTKSLLKLFTHFKDKLEGDFPWSYDRLKESKTIREFDERFTAPNFGYKDVDEYYKAACLHDKLQSIRVPFLCLTSADDPFSPLEGIPLEQASKSSHVALVVTSRGGHVGFLEGLFPYKTFLGDRFIKQFLKAVFSNLNKVHDAQREGEEFVRKSS